MPLSSASSLKLAEGVKRQRSAYMAFVTSSLGYANAVAAMTLECGMPRRALVPSGRVIGALA